LFPIRGSSNYGLYWVYLCDAIFRIGYCCTILDVFPSVHTHRVILVKVKIFIKFDQILCEIISSIILPLFTIIRPFIGFKKMHVSRCVSIYKFYFDQYLVHIEISRRSFNSGWREYHKDCHKIYFHIICIWCYIYLFIFLCSCSLFKILNFDYAQNIG
jgi:hypothetical protein